MLVAGEPSGDLLAAELVTALREGLMDQACLERADLQASDTSLEPGFFGAGGPKNASCRSAAPS